MGDRPEVAETTTEAERHARVSELFARALSLEKTERDELLSNECAGDEGLRREVEGLLAHSGDEPLFVDPLPADTPPPNVSSKGTRTISS